MSDNAVLLKVADYMGVGCSAAVRNKKTIENTIVYRVLCLRYSLMNLLIDMKNCLTRR